MTTESQIAANRKDALIMGLYSSADYVPPEERALYKEFCETLYTELCPEGILEQTFAAEITGAAWRLRRCSAVEAVLADASIDRARAHAHSLLHRSVNQLRRLQTERACRMALNAQAEDSGLADYQHVVIAANNYEHRQHLVAKSSQIRANAAIGDVMRVEEPDELASNCKPASTTPPTPRSAPCPCHSGEKYKRCCGKNAPPMLFNKAA